MAHDEAVKIIECLIPDWAASLVHSDEVVRSLIAGTNTSEWGFDTYKSMNAWFNGKGKINFTVEIILNGEQDPDKTPCGSSISVKIDEGKAVHSNGEWQINSYKVLNSQLNDS
ncbi:MAG: hypothetical protein AB1861_15915 [Cyanobacteriota bacterium]